jgi:hypothetical protein
MNIKHLAATLIKESSDLLLNTSFDQQNYIKKIFCLSHQHCLNNKNRPERQLELLLFSLYNYINLQADNRQISRTTNFINDLTHVAEIQENYLRRLEIEVAND